MFFIIGIRLPQAKQLYNSPFAYLKHPQVGHLGLPHIKNIRSAAYRAACWGMDLL